jgi:hypothetical protein
MTKNISKEKWEAIIVTVTLFFCVIGLAGLSYISFFQTLFAFKPLNDPTMIVGGVAVGGWVAFLCACIFQYGQNAALYIRKIYGTNKVIFNFMGFFDVKNSDIYLIVFSICALIDGGTNIIWLDSQPEVALQATYLKVIEYSVMALLVFVEEVLGITLQAFSHSIQHLKEINSGISKPAFVANNSNSNNNRNNSNLFQGNNQKNNSSNARDTRTEDTYKPNTPYQSKYATPIKSNSQKSSVVSGHPEEEEDVANYIRTLRNGS